MTAFENRHGFTLHRTPSHGDFDRKTNTVFDENVDRWVNADAFYAHYGIDAPTYTDADTRMPFRKAFAIVVGSVAAFLVLLALTGGLGGGHDDTSEPVTKADRFLAQMEEEEIANTRGDTGQLEAGFWICGLAQDGYSYNEIVNTVSDNSPGLGYGKSMVLVSYAIEILCPQYS
ncbi:hypothetical protein SEA_REDWATTLEHOG_193 [Gordonia phage RedWattleHog]|uniref:DUF732 domain-containing protein n=1 Tax=Gordonia phage Stormageddon TaxID=2656541 RepID=A0A649VS77_9CAUD|nr:hypothetical protein KHQ86_gp106 [Gordonia phage Stormageddon]QGJ95054.1 hypothetical protein SEA_STORMAGEDDON_194 [Gordonia phage Stormageddon]QLF83696.1 hypothetical protein SEA_REDWATTLEHOG_193 [Gordonia phage RedWattleHog]